MTEVPDRTGGLGGEAKERRGKTPAEVSIWKWVVDLVHAAFGEGKLSREKRGRRWL